uniref:Right handed beta helix domain-containing protein n=3 Tax=Amphimedon queenslandica TaxID=400682 RepID=A0A1X7TGK9_AMPQE
MSLLLVVVLLFFSSSCSVSSHQYYVSDDCSSVTQSPCNPLSVYAGNMSQYNNTIFYFIGTSSIRYDDIKIIAVKNVTLHGLDQSSHLYCYSSSILVNDSSHINISSLTIYTCPVNIHSSNNITIIDSLFMTKAVHFSIKFKNAFDVKVLSSVFIAYVINIQYYPLPVCSNELLHYSLILTNIILKDSQLELAMQHSTSYNVSINFDYVDFSSFEKSPSLFLSDSLFYFVVTNSLFHHATAYGYKITFFFTRKSTSDCNYPGVELTSIIVFEDSQFYHNRRGLSIRSDMYLPGTINYHFIIRSCLIYDNINEGLYIDGTLLRFTQIDIINTKLIGNEGNRILNSNAISFSNVTVANSTSTGLTLEVSILMIKNNLIFRNNTGVVGGGLTIKDSSALIITLSANLKFIDNHASYKGGGIYIEELTSGKMKLMTPHIPLTLINNTAGLVGGDMYGYNRFSADKYQFNLTNPNISSTSDAVAVWFCDPINTKRHFHREITQHIYPGETLKWYVTLLGHNYFRKLSLTDGTVKVYGKSSSNSTLTLVSQKYIPNTCLLIEYAPKLTQYQSYKLIIKRPHKGDHYLYINYIFDKCPIGFSTSSSQGSCTCSQSVSRENVTCDINTLNITHNGLLWIGTYHTSTPFNANATNPNACIINEDCLLYCSPNPVTFKLNDTHTQCVDNRGQRMCGSCRKGYSLLMGSNKCGHCHNSYMMIAWIALFAVMGILLVVLLIALNLTVSVGTLNGLLFYTNIVKLYESVFSRKGALPVLSRVISWINLDFGFEICFYNGMDSYTKQWIQFAFPLYLWIIIIIIIQLCRRYENVEHSISCLLPVTPLQSDKL